MLQQPIIILYMDLIHIPKGNYYMIVCRAHEQALKIEQTDPQKHKKSKIVSAQCNPQDNSQIFMIERVDGENYEIVSCLSDYVLEEDGNQIKLHNGKQAKDQLFTLVEAASNNLHKFYSIKCSHKHNMALALEGCLRMATYDPSSFAQQFKFEEVNNPTIMNSCLIINNASGKVLDIPKASEKAGQKVIIWNKNKRWNQRWILEKAAGNKFFIKNLLSGLYLDIAGARKESGTKVIQWTKTGGQNQLWTFYPVANKVYVIHSVLQHSLRLAIRKQQTQNGSKVEVCDTTNPTTYWQIEGISPK